MINELEFSKLIADVEQEFGAYLAKAESANTSGVQALSKSFEGKEEPKEEEEEEDGKPEHKPEEKDEESKPEHKEEAKEDEKSPEHKPEEGKEEGEEEGHGYDEDDMNHMHEMYGSMNKHELKAHHDSVRSALDKCMGMDKKEAAPAHEAPKAPEAMQKSEISIEIPVTTPELELVKSELSAEKAKSDELKKSFDLVTQLLSKLVKKGAPQGKAVTSVETLAKSETTEVTNLSAVQISEILTRKAKDLSMSKDDREAINSYYLAGKSISTINHLLK